MKPAACPEHISFIAFFADWCGYCKSFKPEFVDAMQRSTMGNITTHWHIFEDHTEEGRLAIEKYGVKGFPTVLIHLPHDKPDKYVQYTGPRTSDSLIEFIHN